MVLTLVIYSHYAHPILLKCCANTDDLVSILRKYQLEVVWSGIAEDDIISFVVYPDANYLESEDEVELTEKISLYESLLNSGVETNQFEQYHHFYKAQYRDSLLDCPGMRQVQVLARILNESNQQLILYYLTSEYQLHVFLVTQGGSVYSDPESVLTESGINSNLTVIFYNQNDGLFYNTKRKSNEEKHTEPQYTQHQGHSPGLINNTARRVETLLYSTLEKATIIIIILIVGIVLGVNLGN